MEFDYEASFVEIRFPTRNDVVLDNFLKVAETLTRIGAPAYSKVVGDEKPTLWQSCLLLHKRQRYFICHYKELFLLDGKAAKTTISTEDYARRNRVAILLEDWGLVEIVDYTRVETPIPAPVESIKIIPFREKTNWNLKTKYSIGGLSHARQRHNRS